MRLHLKEDMAMYVTELLNYFHSLSTPKYYKIKVKPWAKTSKSLD